MLRGNADAALAAVPEGANAVALRVKNARGELLYASALQEAIDVNAVKGSIGANAVIAALTGSEVYTIARINATHDSLYSFAHMADARCAAAQLRRLHMVRSRQHLLFGAGKARRAAVHRSPVGARMCGAWL